MNGDDVVLSVAQVTTLFEAIAQRFPMNSDEREAWVEHCVIAELRGNIMQGARHFGYHWLQRFTDGTTNWGAKIVPVVETAAMAVLDADGAMGAWVSKYAVEFACARAKRSGMFAVAVRNSPDWMMMSYCTRQALKHDCIGLASQTGGLKSRPGAEPAGCMA